jgi:capsular exopolysaccharide synthesis family protein
MRVGSGSQPKVILVTSSVPGEGKSMLSANLAILLAQQNKKVLLVDGDLRTPVLHRRFNLQTETGLSSILAADEAHVNALSTVVPLEVIPGLDVMTAGPLSPHPADLLASEQMSEVILSWRQHYDFIVIDGAPILPVTDSVLLSTHADLTLVVARHKVTERQSLERTFSLLQSQGAPRIGLVLNAIKRSTSTYYDYYGYNKSGYYGGNQCVS